MAASGYHNARSHMHGIRFGHPDAGTCDPRRRLLKAQFQLLSQERVRYTESAVVNTELSMKAEGSLLGCGGYPEALNRFVQRIDIYTFTGGRESNIAL